MLNFKLKLVNNSLFSLRLLKNYSSTKSKKLISRISIDPCWICVNNVPLHWKEDDIDVNLSKFGKIKKIDLPEDKNGNNLGKALIQFELIGSSFKAVENILKNETEPLKLIFFKNFFTQKEVLHKRNIIMIKNLSESITKEILMSIISEYSTPIYIHFPPSDGVTRNAIVYFSDNMAENVMDALHLKKIKDNIVHIYYANKEFDITTYKRRREMDVNFINDNQEKELLKDEIEYLENQNYKGVRENYIKYLKKALVKFDKREITSVNKI